MGRRDKIPPDCVFPSRATMNLPRAVLVSLVVAVVCHYAKAECSPSQFPCSNGNCVYYTYFCDRSNNCGDNSDEKYCNVDPSFQCPVGWTSCPNNRRCIPSQWMCDGRTHCTGVSETSMCEKVKVWKQFLLNTRKPGFRSDHWGSEIQRIAVALHLADDSTFVAGNTTGEEIRYELTIQLLHRLAFQVSKMSSQELALNVHALLVSCLDPRDFYGRDLVRELRKKVEATGNHTDPFLILALCNAGDRMTTRDVERVTASYDSQRRPFWMDSQALSSMALSCISSRGGLTVDNATLTNMLQGLKRRQATNGTVDNFRTTALVTQALFIDGSYKTDFNLNSSMQALFEGFGSSKSILNAYYTLPVYFRKNLLNVTSRHCRKNEDEIVQKLLDIHGETVTVRLSVWVGEEINLVQTWRVKMCVNSSVYDAIETVAGEAIGHRVQYDVVSGKPYLSGWNGRADDPEMGTFWFVYLKTGRSQKIVEESPADVKLKNNQEIILWYKRGPWSSQNLKQRSSSSS